MIVNEIAMLCHISMGVANIFANVSLVISLST